MTDEQAIAAALLGVAGAISAAIKWAAGLIVKSQDNNAAMMKEEQRLSRETTSRNTDVLIENTASNAVLSTKIDAIASFVHTGKTPIAGVPITPLDPPQQHQTTIPRKSATPAGGYRIQRPGTQGNDR